MWVYVLVFLTVGFSLCHALLIYSVYRLRRRVLAMERVSRELDRVVYLMARLGDDLGDKVFDRDQRDVLEVEERVWN